MALKPKWFESEMDEQTLKKRQQNLNKWQQNECKHASREIFSTLISCFRTQTRSSELIASHVVYGRSPLDILKHFLSRPSLSIIASIQRSIVTFPYQRIPRFSRLTGSKFNPLGKLVSLLKSETQGAFPRLISARHSRFPSLHEGSSSHGLQINFIRFFRFPSAFSFSAPRFYYSEFHRSMWCYKKSVGTERRELNPRDKFDWIYERQRRLTLVPETKGELRNIRRVSFGGSGGRVKDLNEAFAFNKRRIWTQTSGINSKFLCK